MVGCPTINGKFHNNIYNTHRYLSPYDNIMLITTKSRCVCYFQKN